jgi:hypothetical protein
MINKTGLGVVSSTKGILHQNVFDVVLIRNYNERERTSKFKYSGIRNTKSINEIMYYFSCSYPLQD